jgi:hypothetical protein
MTYLSSPHVSVVIAQAVREVLDRECLCQDRPLYPTDEQYNPACPCHERTA